MMEKHFYLNDSDGQIILTNFGQDPIAYNRSTLNSIEQET